MLAEEEDENGAPTSNPTVFGARCAVSSTVSCGVRFMKMKKTALTFAVLASVAVVLAADQNHKAYMFAPTNFGMLVPAGFSRDNRPGPPPDFMAWVFTNAAGSRLSFMMGGHWNATGVKTEFKGFAALEFKTNLVRRITFDSAGFSHVELERIGRHPEYDALIEYRAANEDERKTMDQAVDTFFVLKKTESNHTSEGIRRPADGSPKPSM